MPGLNGNGPLGEGAMTGRGMGRCTGKGTMFSGFVPGGGKRAFARRPFGGRGRRGMLWGASSWDGAQGMQDEAAYLNEQKDLIEKRLAELEQNQKGLDETE
jgi:hypothetical protein